VLVHTVHPLTRSAKLIRKLLKHWFFLDLILSEVPGEHRACYLAVNLTDIMNFTFTNIPVDNVE